MKIKNFADFLNEKLKKKKTGSEPVKQTETDLQDTPSDDKEALERSVKAQRLL